MNREDPDECGRGQRHGFKAWFLHVFHNFLFCRRLHAILYEAPWSNFDLLTSIMIGLTGAYLLLPSKVLESHKELYGTLLNVASEDEWGWFFLVNGIIGFSIVAWCERPPFILRLMARMTIAFCLLSLFGNAANNAIPPPGSITWAVLSLGAVWGICRTSRHGR